MAVRTARAASKEGHGLATSRTARSRSGAGKAFAPRRGRPTADQAEAISRAIIAAATEIFLAAGYEGAAMDAVAARAGVPKSTLYKRYPDKKALLRAVVRQRLSEWALSVREEDLGDDLETRLKHLAAAMVVRAISPELRAVYGLVASAWGGPGEAATRRDAIGYSAMLDRLAREIRDHGPKRGLRAQDPRRPAGALMAMLNGWLLWDAPAEGDLEAQAVRFAHTAVELLMKGSAAW
jgi:AcrR family transcriptional regulator